MNMAASKKVPHAKFLFQVIETIHVYMIQMYIRELRNGYDKLKGLTK